MSRFAVAGTALLSLASISSAFGQPTKEACVEAYKGSQQLRHNGALRAAREQLLICARDPCPAVLQTDCVTWLAEVEPRIPTLVVKARMGASSDISDVRVLMDGIEIAARLDGHAIDVDPGEHVFAFERAGAVRVEKRVLIVEGERGRVIDVELTASPPPPPIPGAERPVPRSVLVLGAAGIAAFGIGGVFGTLGLIKRDELSTCRPQCDRSEIDVVKQRFLVADIACVAGSAALVGAAVLYWTRPSVGVFAAPTEGGAMVSISRAF